jgi:hypothetical protein
MPSEMNDVNRLTIQDMITVTDVEYAQTICQQCDEFETAIGGRCEHVVYREIDRVALDGDLNRLIDMTIEDKHLDIVYDRAAEHGHIHLLEWAANRSIIPNRVYSTAACYGRLDVMIWARSHNVRFHSSMYKCAIEYGYMNIIQWLYDTGCPWYDDNAVLAATYNRFDILKWAFEHGE